MIAGANLLPGDESASRPIIGHLSEAYIGCTYKLRFFTLAFFLLGPLPFKFYPTGIETAGIFLVLTLQVPLVCIDHSAHLLGGLFC